MALVLADRVQETTTTSGTGTVTLLGAVPGFQDFLTGIGSGNTTFYTLYDPTTYEWEVGIGTFTSSGTDTLSRDTVLSNSLGSTAKINLAGNQTNVFVTYPSEKSVNLDSSGNVSPLGTISSGTWQGSTVGVAYGGTGVTTSSGANSVMLRDSNQNVQVNRIAQTRAVTTAAGGTTVLTVSSAFVQTLIGTGGQTFQLPDATTIPVGTWFLFDNDATSTLTVTDYGTTTVDTTAPGGYSLLILEDASTVAGIWIRAGLIPHEVNWGTNNLDLGGLTTITNGTWQGNAVTPAYGGTGLNSFSAANNALYSTGATTLTAGTLPIAAGGTGQTTANAALNALLPSQATNSGKYLTTDGTNSSWATVTQTTFSAGTTGFTPNTPTSGAVTLAGTLNVANGGTGLTSLTANYIPYGNGTSPYQSSASFTYDGTTLTAANYSTPGNLTFTGTGNRITGDFTNNTHASRVAFQSSTTNGATNVGIIPNGTSTTAVLGVFNNSNADNSAFGNFSINTASLGINSNIIGTGSYVPITFSTGGSERMRIDTSGNVGIGTSIPAEKLDVNGNIYLRPASPVVYTGGTLTFQSGSASPLIFNTNAGAERMRIDSSGNVGIGTSSPSSYGKLAVEGINHAITARSGNAGWCEIAVQSGSTDAVKGQFQAIEGTTNKVIIGSRTNHPLAFNVADTECMRIDSSGNVTVSKASRGTITTDNDLSFDMNAASNFSCTPTAGGTLTFTNITAGQSGYILLVNNSNYVITAAATTKVGVSFLSTISTTGTYLISYFSNGTNVFCTTSGALS